MNKISAKTPITISLMISIMVVVVWAITVWADVRANSKSIEQIEVQQKIYVDNVQSIDKRLSRIEGALNINTKEK